MLSVGDVAREGARCKQDHIYADIVFSARIVMCNRLGRCGDACEPPRIYGMIEIALLLAPLDFDEGNQALAPGHQVNFAHGCLDPLGKDRPALGSQPQGSPLFTLAAFLLGALPLHSFSSMARA